MLEEYLRVMTETNLVRISFSIRVEIRGKQIRVQEWDIIEEPPMNDAARGLIIFSLSIHAEPTGSGRS